MMLVTFHLVALAWIFFRADGIGQAWHYLTGITSLQGGFNSFGVAKLGFAVLILALIDIPQYRANSHVIFLRWAWPIRTVVYTGLFLTLCIFRSDGDLPFIYFQF